jgi:hypothetical protein
MKPGFNKRWWWWLAGLAVTLTLVAKNHSNDSYHATSAVTVTDHTRHLRSHRASKDNRPQYIALNLLHRSKTSDDTSDLFRSKSWYVPPPPAPPAPPPIATAPPLPFTFIGKVQKPDGKLTLFLSDQNRVYLVHGGETLSHTYHVDGIEHGKLALTYLPLKKKQYLNLVEAH